MTKKNTLEIFNLVAKISGCIFLLINWSGVRPNRQERFETAKGRPQRGEGMDSPSNRPRPTIIHKNAHLAWAFLWAID